MDRAQENIAGSSAPVSVEANFQEDLRLHYLSELTNLGAKPPNETDDVFAVCAGYFNVEFRLIPKRARTVLKSRELARRRLSHGQRSRLGTIVKEMATGTELRHRLSKNILKPDYNDKLLHDWGIHHLHVGPQHAPHGRELLYVYVTNEMAHLIDWQEHGVESFANQALMQILHDNWPNAIEHEKPVGVVPGSLTPSDLMPAERQRLREKFTLCTQTTDGTIYLPLGGGTTLAGGSTRVLRRVQHERQLAQNVQEWVTENAGAVSNALARHTGQRLDHLKLRYLVGRPLRVQEQRTGVVVNLPEEEEPR
jgi:hypothetical protein